jgi:hypothetical protein
MSSRRVKQLYRWANPSGQNEAQNEIGELRLRQERRLGEMLREMEKNKGGNPNLLHDATGSGASLTELGIERTQAHRWQLEAAVPSGASRGP